jgi:hypothetical protein
MRDRTTGKVASILLPSVAQGVGHEQRCTAALFSCSPFAPPPLSSYVVAFACRKSRAAGVGHVANRAASVSVVPECRPLSVEYAAAALDAASPLVGVGHPDGTEVEPLSDVRRPDARSAQIRSPDGVALSFQVSANNVEPREAIPARNLLPKHD